MQVSGDESERVLLRFLLSRKDERWEVRVRSPRLQINPNLRPRRRRGDFIPRRPGGFLGSLPSLPGEAPELLCDTRECLDRNRFQTQTEARMAVFDFIEGFYNPRRRHSSLNYLSPLAYERNMDSSATTVNIC